MNSGLGSGFYRVRMKRTFLTTKNGRLISYLRVTMQGKEKFFQIDNGIPFLVTEDDEMMQLNRFEVIGKIEKPISVYKPKITVSFQDDIGYEVEMQVSNLKAFEHILEEFPRLKKELSMSS